MNRGNNMDRKPGMATYNKILMKLELFRSKLCFSTFFCRWAYHHAAKPLRFRRTPSTAHQQPRPRPDLSCTGLSCSHRPSSARHKLWSTSSWALTTHHSWHTSHLRALCGPAEPDTATGNDFRCWCLAAGCQHPSPLTMLQCHTDLLPFGLDDKSEERKTALFKSKKHVCMEKKKNTIYPIYSKYRGKNRTELQERWHHEERGKVVGQVCRSQNVRRRWPGKTWTSLHWRIEKRSKHSWQTLA